MIIEFYNEVNEIYVSFWLYYAALDIKETNLIIVLEKWKTKCICGKWQGKWQKNATRIKRPGDIT